MRCLFLWVNLCLLCFLCLIIPSKAFSIYSLNELPLLNNNCPFLHKDEYASNLGQLNDIIRVQLKTKIEENHKCNAAFNDISLNLNTITDLFKYRTNPSLQQDINDEVLSKQLMQLKLDLITTDATNSSHSLIQSQIQDVENRLFLNQATQGYNKDYFAQQRDNDSISKVFTHMNQVISSLSNMPAECVDQLGGWNQVLPTILNSLSSLSALSGFAYSSFIGAGLKLISSLTILLKDVRAKKVLKDMIQHKNNKILACTYFAVQNTACEYKRALKFSHDYDKIKNIIQHKYEDKETKRYEEFFNLLEHSNEFGKVFTSIAAMGSAITLDSALIANYFEAMRSNPKTIFDDFGQPPADDQEGPEADNARQDWLIKVRNRGIHSPARSPFGGINSLKEQVKAAKQDIDNKIADIATVEGILILKRSFVDLKHELDTFPNLSLRVTRYVDFLKRVMQGKVVHVEKKGVVASALSILVSLEKFLTIKYSEESSAENFHALFEKYTEEVNAAGRELFSVMSEGAVAQLTQQTVLSVGQVVQDRILRVFRMLEEEFLREDIVNSNSCELQESSKLLRFSDYKRDRAILTKVALNYGSFSGAGKTFRVEDVNIAFKALENGFSGEIHKMISSALKEKHGFYDDLDGETGAHLCALFGQSLHAHGLNKLIYGSLLKKCKARYKKLELMKIIENSEIEIDWDDPCFYANYRRLLTTQQSLYYKMQNLGFSF